MLLWHSLVVLQHRQWSKIRMTCLACSISQIFLDRRPISGVRAGGSRGAPPWLETIRANSVFRESSSCSKVLKDKKYFNTVKIFRANSVFQGKRRLFKILNDKKYVFITVNSRHTLFFRASTSCSNILNVKSILNTAKNFMTNSVFRANFVFQGKCKLFKILND